MTFIIKTIKSHEQYPCTNIAIIHSINIIYVHIRHFLSFFSKQKKSVILIAIVVSNISHQKTNQLLAQFRQEESCSHFH